MKLKTVAKGRIRFLHRRARNIVVDYCWKMAKQIVLYAKRRQYAIALEDCSLV